LKQNFFGTDGVRGRVGTEPITPQTLVKLGWAAGRILGANGSGRGKILIGKDTRVSGYMVESALEAGLSAAGVDVVLLGPMPTPGIAYLTRTTRARAGIVVSASHNPYYDNGIKFFSPEGTKLPDAVELAIAEQMERPLEPVDTRELGKAERLPDAAGRYIEYCKSTFPHRMNLKGITVAVDCSNGAAYDVAPNVFSELDAKVVAIGDDPDGFNINEDCGSTHPQALQRAVREAGADVGIALDGDGDRVIMVDADGEILDGDRILYILAMARHRAGRLNGGVVGTLMSNLGLEQALAQENIPFQRAAVGDRYVLALMVERGWNLGGESSGHIICLDKSTTGDGIVAALEILSVMTESGQTLAQLGQGMKVYPQHMINVPLTLSGAGRFDVGSSAAVREAVRTAEQELAAHGRVLLRSSGTEPVVRVMVEGQDREQVERLTQFLADAVRGAAAAA
jgi:phosphoglucosamine mutase